MSSLLAGRCCICVRVALIGKTELGQWKGNATTKYYCVSCCDRLGIQKDPDRLSLDHKVRSAASYLLQSGKRFTRMDVCRMAGIERWDNFKKAHPELAAFVESSVEESIQRCVLCAIASFGENPFTVEDLCQSAGINPAVIGRRPELKKFVRNAALSSRGGMRGRAGQTEIDEEYCQAISPQNA